MTTQKNNRINRLPIIMISLIIYAITGFAQKSQVTISSINIVPAGLSKNNRLVYSDKSAKLKLEFAKLIEEKKIYDQKFKNLSKDQSVEEMKKIQDELASLTRKEKELSAKTALFNAEIEEVVYKDPSLDKLSTVTYYTLKQDQKLWDEFQNNMANERLKLKQDKIKIHQELTKIKIKIKKTKTAFNEGIVLSMYAEQELADTLKSPYTGLVYKEILENRQKNMTDSGVIIVSFIMPKHKNDPIEAATRMDGHVPSEVFSLAGPNAKAELNKLKDKKFKRLIAHSNGAAVVECLLNDSLIEVKELTIIGGEKSLLNGQSLQKLLDNGTVKRIVVWVKLDDPALWITPLTDANIAERTQNFISHKTRMDKMVIKTDNSKVEYKWILGSESIALLSAKDPQFISTYFREISKDLRSN